ncbi:hypothetical protein DV20_29350 [Amycolatopsis rifamycinica]|uniref:Uncharacterized protein n=1 Tax=Amycolatopsis rifamycinica TaxID=287986 RepID=A0A066TU87_9PSEU|nr:hypothetical protein DV20_29350 [Amycolatopsis rifamycinica]
MAAGLLLLPLLTAESCVDERTGPSSSVPAPAVGGDTAGAGSSTTASGEVSSSDVAPAPEPTTPLIPEPTGTPTGTPGQPDTTEVTAPPPTP